MSFDISMIDRSGLSLYFLLFDSEKSTLAYNIEKGAFEVFNNNQSKFAIIFQESEERTGNYFAKILNSDNIIATINDNSYAIEIWERNGKSISRNIDMLISVSFIFWDGTKSIPFNLSTKIVPSVKPDSPKLLNTSVIG